MNLAYLISSSTIITIILYNVSIIESWDSNSLVIKSIIIR